MSGNLMNKLRKNYFWIIILSIVSICILYTVLNFRGHIVIKNNKVIGYKWGIVEKVKRDMIITIPEGTTEIMYGAFANCIFIKEVHMPESVEIIHEYAFKNCTNLSSINFAESLETIEYGAFSNCSMLEFVELPSSVTNIGEEAFFECTNLKKVILPENLNIIRQATFSECKNLEIIQLVNVEVIEGSAFS